MVTPPFPYSFTDTRAPGGSASDSLGFDLAEQGPCFQLLGLFLEIKLAEWVWGSEYYPNKQGVWCSSSTSREGLTLLQCPLVDLSALP